jgi:hypothetical protein
MSGFTSFILPPFMEGTACIGKPKAGPDVVVCRTPTDIRLSTPWGQELDTVKGTAHTAQDEVGDHYPNLEFDDFYVVTSSVNPDNDRRAAFLHYFWLERGYEITEFGLAKKIKPAIVLGDVDSSAWGMTFVNHEGSTPLEEGKILMSPLDPSARWFVRLAVYTKKYDSVATLDQAGFNLEVVAA